MKAHLLDIDALRSISPAALSAYARAEGWQKGDQYGSHSDVYEAAGKPELVVPRTSNLGDYPAVVSQLIGIFADVAQRDEFSLYRDLVGADRDVIRIQCLTSTDDGSVDIEAGVRIVSHSRDMLLAAACAARQPQPLFRAGANRDATEYMRRVRLGQTEHGSFVVTLLAPVPPAFQAVLDPEWVDFGDEPYDRQVTRRLIQALEASRSATELASSGEGLKAFERAVQSGVSANLCEALSEMIDQSNGINVSVTWARTRPTPEPQRTVSFSPDDAEILREAARTFKSRHPIADVTLVGTVNKLSRDQDEVDGLVTLKAVIDNKLQSVRAIFDKSNYSEAVRAHDDKLQVLVSGDLERFGQRWQLTHAEIVALEPGADDDDQVSNSSD